MSAEVPKLDVAKVTVKADIRQEPGKLTVINTDAQVAALEKKKVQEGGSLDKSNGSINKTPQKKIEGPSSEAPEPKKQATEGADPKAKGQEESHLARISQIEREKREAQQAWQQAQAEKAELAKGLDDWKKFESDVKRDPRSVLKKFGLTYKQLTDIIIEHGIDGKLPEPVVNPEVAKLQKELDEQKAKQTLAEQQRSEAARNGLINTYLQKVDQHFATDPDAFECTIRRIKERRPASNPAFNDSVSEHALTMAQEYFKATGKEPTPQFVAESLERYYEDEDTAAVRGTKKLKMKLGIKDEEAGEEAPPRTKEEIAASKANPARHSPKVSVKDAGPVTVGAGTDNKFHKSPNTIGRNMLKDTNGAKPDLNTMSSADRRQWAIDEANRQFRSKRK